MGKVILEKVILRVLEVQMITSSFSSFISVISWHCHD